MIIYTVGAMAYYGEFAEYPKKWREDVSNWFEKYSTNIKCIHPTDFYDYGSNHHKSEREIFRFDLRKVREADLILVNLKDLNKSIGSSDEILYAFISGKPIVGFLDDETLKDDIHPWKIEEIDRIETGKNAMVNALLYIRNFYDRTIGGSL